MRQSVEVLISHVFPTSRWTSDPEVDAGCCSHLEFWALFPVYMGVDAVSPFKGAFQQPTRCSYRRQAAENDVPFTMRNGKLHFLALAFTIALNGAGGRDVIRTQARPAIEFVSGEEGLRPKSYFIVFPFVEYTFMDALNYEMAPGSSCGQRRWRSPLKDFFFCLLGSGSGGRSSTCPASYAVRSLGGVGRVRA